MNLSERPEVPVPHAGDTVHTYTDGLQIFMVAENDESNE